MGEYTNDYRITACYKKNHYFLMQKEHKGPHLLEQVQEEKNFILIC